MKRLNLPFNLGMDYEELEFELEILPDRIQGYDSYIYLGKFNNFLNYNTDKIELLFRMDVLEGIIINYNYLSSRAFDYIANQLESLLGNPQIVYEHGYNEHGYKLYKFNVLDSFVILMYGNNDITLLIVIIPDLVNKILYTIFDKKS